VTFGVDPLHFSLLPAYGDIPRCTSSGAPPDQMHLFFEDKPLRDDETPLPTP